MESKGFSIGVQLKKGWHLMKEHAGFFIGFLIIYLVISLLGAAFLGGAVTTFFPDMQLWLSITIGVVLTILGLVMWLGFIRSCLKASRGESLTYADLFSGFPIIVQFIVATIMYVIIVAVGLILFIIPGLVWGSRYFLYPFPIVDKGVGPISALEESGKITKGSKWDIFLLIALGIIVFHAFWFVGMIPLLIVGFLMQEFALGTTLIGVLSIVAVAFMILVQLVAVFGFLPAYVITKANVYEKLQKEE